MNGSFCLTVPLCQEETEKFLAYAYGFDISGIEEQDDCLKLYFLDENETYSAKSFFDKLPDSLCSVEFIKNRDWNENWKNTIQPVKVAGNIWVSPDWLKPEMSKGDHWIKIEPKMAFGTGHHETTRLAAEAILSLGGVKSLLDIGTGSGILCFIADYAGIKQSFGVEIDSNCRENLHENYKLNNPVNSVNFFIGTVDSLTENYIFDVIVMNMIKPRSMPLLGFCRKHLYRDGILVWSGILIAERDEVVKNAIGEGYDIVSERVKGEWWCGILKISE